MGSNQIWVFVTFSSQRILYFFPAAFSCFSYVCSSPLVSWAVTLPFAFALIALSAFNLLIVGIMSIGILKLTCPKEAELKMEHSERVSRRSVDISTMSVTASLSNAKKELADFDFAGRASCFRSGPTLLRRHSCL